MAKSLLSKSQSGVFALLYTLMFCIFNSYANATPPTTQMNSTLPFFCQSQAGWDSYIERECSNPDPAKKQNCKEREKEACKNAGNTSARPCEEARKDWSKAVTEFSAACGKAGMTSKKGDASSRQGEIGCSSAIAACENCTDEDASEDTAAGQKFQCSAYADASDGSGDTDLLDTIQRSVAGAGARRQVTPDLNESRRLFSICPSLAGEDLKSYLDEVTKAQKEVRELEDKIPTLQEQMSKLIADAEKKNNELQERSSDIETKAKDEAQKAKENLEDAEKKMADDIDKLNEEITKENANIRQIEMTRVQARTAYNDHISRQDLECHSMALKRIDAERTRRLQEMSNSTYSAGDQNDLFSGVGLSSRQKNQIAGDEYFRFCQQDRTYQLSMKSAQAALANAQLMANEAAQNATKRIAALEKKISAIKTTDAYRAKQRTYDRLVKIQETMNKELDKLNREKTAAQTNLQRETKILSDKIQLAQRRLQEEQDYLRQKQAYLAAKQKYAPGGRSTAEGAKDEAVGKFGAVMVAADTYANSCKCNSSPEEGNCKQVVAFICYHRGGDTSACKDATTPLFSKGNTSTTPRSPAGTAAGSTTAQ